MYCTSCGAPVESDAKFCTSCGAKIASPDYPAESLNQKTSSNLSILTSHKKIYGLVTIIVLAVIAVFCVFYFMQKMNSNHTVEVIDEKESLSSVEKEDFTTPEAPAVHEHQLAYVSSDDNNHVKSCVVEDCDYSVEEKCTYDDSGECICGNMNVTIMEEHTKKIFYNKYKGVWFNPKSKYYIVIEENGNTKRGILSTDDHFPGHIEEITESEDGYDIEIIEEEIDNDLISYSGGDFIFYLKNTKLETLINMGEKDDPLYFMRMDYIENLSDLLNDLESTMKRFIASVEIVDPDSLNESPVGRWFTQFYDERSNWSDSYIIKLDENGNAVCTGYRDNDSGTYEQVSYDTFIITFSNCLRDEPGEGWTVMDGYSYTVKMVINGNSATITVDDPDVISNLSEGQMYREMEEY